MRTLKKLMTAALFSSVLLAGTASAQSCNLPCLRAYQACMAAGTDAMQCFEAYDSCRYESCGAG